MIKFTYFKVLSTFCIVFCIYLTEAWCHDQSAISNCSCGLEYSISGRIFGGVEAKEAEFPWHVALYKGNFYYCGGTIINNLYILSAGHCFKYFANGIVDEVPITSVSIVLGGHHVERLNLYKAWKQNPDIRTIKYVVVHNHFVPRTFVNDVALVRMGEPLTEYSFKTLPICLPQIEQSFVGQEATVIGWGAKFSGHGPVPVLRKTNVTVLPDTECAKKLRNHFYQDIMICAASPGHDACQGDSGGPLMIKHTVFKYMQVGVVSFGIGCGDYFNPGIYSRLNKFIRWIKNHTSDAIYCEH